MLIKPADFLRYTDFEGWEFSLGFILWTCSHTGLGRSGMFARVWPTVWSDLGRTGYTPNPSWAHLVWRLSTGEPPTDALVVQVNQLAGCVTAPTERQSSQWWGHGVEMVMRWWGDGSPLLSLNRTSADGNFQRLVLWHFLCEFRQSKDENYFVKQKTSFCQSLRKCTAKFLKQ